MGGISSVQCESTSPLPATCFLKKTNQDDQIFPVFRRQTGEDSLGA
jgi:hypothetical protein